MNASGTVGEKLEFGLLVELLATPGLFEYYTDYKIMPEFNIRVGQHRAHYTRAFITSSTQSTFLERSRAIFAFRYDRSPGVAVQGELFDERFHYYASVSNGSGRNRPNDNIDFAYLLRAEFAALGTRPRYSYGDFARSRPTLVLGGGAVYDLAPLPGTVGDIEVGQTDVDNDGSVDNIRVVSASADVLFRWAGFEAVVEGLYRHEDWGAILEHPDNFELGDTFDFSEGRNYLGLDVQASYFVLDDLLVGARFAHSRQPLLQNDGLSRLPVEPPRADRLMELDGVVQLYNDRGQRWLGLSYTYFNWNTKDGPEVSADTEHRVILETQLQWR